MAGIDYYRDLNLDISVGVNYPTGMVNVFEAVQGMLHEKGKYLVSNGPIAVAEAREIAATRIVDHKAYYVVETNDPKVWGILRNAVNEDRIRVFGVFHGKIPDTIPENMLIIDVGQSLHRKVTKPIVSAIQDSIGRSGKYPKGKTEDVFSGLLTLCYEVIYSPEYKVFNSETIRKVPIPRAFDFMFHPPAVLSDKSMKNACDMFLEDVNGWLE